MTYEEKKEWLRRYRKAAKLEKIKLEEVERYRTDAEHITQVLSPVPGGAGDGQALPRCCGAHYGRYAGSQRAGDGVPADLQGDPERHEPDRGHTGLRDPVPALHRRQEVGADRRQDGHGREPRIPAAQACCEGSRRPGVSVNALFLKQSALFCTVFDERRTVLHCLTCDIIRLRKPQGAGRHPDTLRLLYCPAATGEHLYRPTA